MGRAAGSKKEKADGLPRRPHYSLRLTRFALLKAREAASGRDPEGGASQGGAF
ncbi:hypothetical protein D3C81_1934730 [compost metagenome]